MTDERDTRPAPAPTPEPKARDSDRVMKALGELAKDVKGFKGDVKDLTRIARDCFDHILIQEGRIDRLERRMDVAEARMTLLPPPPNGGADAG